MTNGYRYTTLMDAANAVMGFTTDVAETADDFIRQKAASDLDYMKSQFQLAADDFLLELDKSGNYQTWQEKTDKFISTQGELMQKQSSNAYTARMADQMLAQWNAGLQSTVAKKARAEQVKDVLSTDEMTINNLMNSHEEAQTKLNGIIEVYDREYKGGFIDSANYKSKVLATYSNICTQYLTETAKDAIDQAIVKDDKELLRTLIHDAANKLDLDVTYLHSSEATNEDYTQGTEFIAKKAEYEAKRSEIDKAVAENEKNYKKESERLKQQKRTNESLRIIAKNTPDNVNKFIYGTDPHKEEEYEKKLEEIGSKQTDLETLYNNENKRLSDEREAQDQIFAAYTEQARINGESSNDVRLKMELDRNAIENSVMKNIDAQYNARLQDWQRKNNDKIEQHYSGASNDVLELICGASNKSAEQILNNIIYGAEDVERNYGGNKLASSGQSQWADKYRSLLNAVISFQKEGKSGNSNIKLESLKTLMADIPDNVWEEIKKGNISMQEAADSYQLLWQQGMYGGWYAENSDQITKHKYSQKEIDAIYKSKYSNKGVIEFLGSDKAIKLLQEVDLETYKNYIDCLKKLDSGKIEGTGEAYNYLFNAMYKMMVNYDNNVDKKELARQMNYAIAACTISGDKNLAYFGKEEGAPANAGEILNDQKKHWYKIGNESDTAYMARIVDDLENEDYVTIPVGKTSKEKMYAPGAKEQIERVANQQTDILKNKLGITGEITWDNEQAPALKGGKADNDMNSTIILTDVNGNQYKFRSVKDDNGKPIDYEIIRKNDNKVIAKGSELNRKPTREETKEANAKASEAQKAAHEATKEADWKRGEATEKEEAAEDKKYAEINTTPSIVEKINKNANWERVDGRMEVIRSAVSTLDDMAKKKKKANEFKVMTGITQEEWKKKDAKEKKDFVLES